MTPELEAAIRLLREAELDTDRGMPEELFWALSAMIPIPNVDLLVVNPQGELLLSRRKDEFFGESWHIPGGCMHFNESFAHCIQETARRELHSEVQIEEKAIAVRNVIRGRREELAHPRERGHNVAILFRCTLPEDYRLDNGSLSEEDSGYLKWFARLPDDFMTLQHVYDDILEPWRKKDETVGE